MHSSLWAITLVDGGADRHDGAGQTRVSGAGGLYPRSTVRSLSIVSSYRSCRDHVIEKTKALIGFGEPSRNSAHGHALFRSLPDHEIHRRITKRGFVQDTSEATDAGTDGMAFVLKPRLPTVVGARIRPAGSGKRCRRAGTMRLPHPVRAPSLRKALAYVLARSGSIWLELRASLRRVRRRNRRAKREARRRAGCRWRTGA